MEILAKKLEKTNETQTLEEHTNSVIENALVLLDDKSLKTVSALSGFSEETIVDLIFFSCYFHDIGKATKEFRDTIDNGSQSYHSFYSTLILESIEDFEFVEDSGYFINLLETLCLTHHKLLDLAALNIKCSFLDEAENFFYGYKKSYEKHLNKKCDYNFDFKISTNIANKVGTIKTCLKQIKHNDELRILFAYCSGILNLADWLASANFSNSLPIINFTHIPTKQNLLDKLSFDSFRYFQENLSELEKSVLVEIPTGEGKTEGSILWAMKNLFDKNSKIIYTLPTQVTSNKLYERITSLFDKNECGLIHSLAKSYLTDDYEKEHGIVDDFFRSEILFNKHFSKPITISTIDSLLKFFINIGRFNIATKNFLNSVVIIDEIHCYDYKILGFLKRFLELSAQMNVKVCIMSASVPNVLKKALNINRYSLVTQKELFDKKANEIVKIEDSLDNNFAKIANDIKQNKNILVIRNTVKSASNTYKTLINDFQINKNDIVLYHSTFKKRDKKLKEEEIFKRLSDKKPFILIATQIVEISLDIDFDIMFTDNAPIDALIQRFGRVNRKKNVNKKGYIYIYKYKEKYPYDNDYLLELTFNTIENGFFPLSTYSQWLNTVYDKLFQNDTKTNNEFDIFFKEGYEKYDKTIKILNGIKKSDNNYDLRDIKNQKIDYLLYDDFMNDEIIEKEYHNYTISLPIYYEKKYLYTPQDDIKYKILNIPYTYKEGLILDSNEMENLAIGE